MPVRIREGLPEPLQHLESEELPSYDEWAIELIALWRQDIEALRSTSERLAHLCVGLASLPTWEQRGAAYGEAVERTEAIAVELARYAAMATLLKRIVSVNEDVLGVYRCGSVGGEIDLYWLVIGATARLLGVDVEGLTVTALAHEMAHAYTHLGMDIDGRSWKDGFRKCDSAVVEGIAQYYTHKSLELLKKHGYVKGWASYQAMLSLQSGLYKTHLAWVDRYTPEVLRAALLASRTSSQQPHLRSFNALLADIAHRLQR